MGSSIGSKKRDVVLCDILLYKRNRFISFIMRLFSGGMYCHSEIYLGNNKSIDVSMKGIRIKKLRDKDWKEIDIFRPVMKSSHREVVIQYIETELGKVRNYSILNLLAFSYIKFFRLLGLKWFEGKRFVICSEFVANCLTVGKTGRDIKWLNTPNSLLSPSNLISAFKVIYIG